MCKNETMRESANSVFNEFETNSQEINKRENISKGPVSAC